VASDAGALLFGILPLAVAVSALPRFGHRLRWITVCLYLDLCIFLLAFQHRPVLGPQLALNAVLLAFTSAAEFISGTPTALDGGAFITIAVSSSGQRCS